MNNQLFKAWGSAAKESGTGTLGLLSTLLFLLTVPSQ